MLRSDGAAAGVQRVIGQVQTSPQSPRRTAPDRAGPSKWARKYAACKPNFLHRTIVAHVERLAHNLALDNIEGLSKALGVEPYELLKPSVK